MGGIVSMRVRHCNRVDLKERCEVQTMSCAWSVNGDRSLRKADCLLCVQSKTIERLVGKARKR